MKVSNFDFTLFFFLIFFTPIYTIGQNVNSVVKANFVCLNDEDISDPGDPIEYSSSLDNLEILKVSAGEDFPILYGLTDIDRITNFSTFITQDVVNVGLYKFTFDISPPNGIMLSYNGVSGLDHLDFTVKGTLKLEDIRTKIIIKVPDPWTTNFFNIDMNIKEIANPILPAFQRTAIIDNFQLFQSYTVQKRTTCASEIIVDSPTDIYTTPQSSPITFQLKLKNDAPPAYQSHFIEEKFTFLPLFSVSDITTDGIKQVKAALSINNPTPQQIFDYFLVDIFGSYSGFVANNLNKFDDTYQAFFVENPLPLKAKTTTPTDLFQANQDYVCGKDDTKLLTHKIVYTFKEINEKIEVSFKISKQ